MADGFVKYDDLERLFDKYLGGSGTGRRVKRGGSSYSFDDDGLPSSIIPRVSETEKVLEATERYNKHLSQRKNLLEQLEESQTKYNKLIEEVNKLKDKDGVKFEDLKECRDINSLYEKRKEVIEEIARLETLGTDESKKQIKLLQKKLGYIDDMSEGYGDILDKQFRIREEGYTTLDGFEERIGYITKPLKKGIREIKDGVKTIGKAIDNMVGPWKNISQAAAEFARSVGTSGKAMEALRKKNIESVTSGKLGIRFGISPEELTKLQQTYTNQIGRNIGTSFTGDARLAAMNRVFGENTTIEMISALDNYGVSVEEAGNRAGKMFATASKYGVSLEKVSKTFAENIKRAQGYTFKNGLRDLEAMAKKSAEMKLDLSQVFAMADKVSTVEGAITTGANLQVLGGPFAQMGNPLGMLYEGLNDPNALMDRMIKMFGGLGTFNRQTGEVEVSAFNKQRIKAAAQASGLDYGAVMESVNAQARRGEIGRQIDNLNFSKQTKELIKNVGTIQNGKAGVNYKGEFYTAEQIQAGKLSENELISISQSESENIEDIATTLRGWNDIITGAKKQKEAAQTNIVEKTGLGKFVQGIHNWFGNATGVLNFLAGAKMVSQIALAITGIWSIAKGTTRIIGILDTMRGENAASNVLGSGGSGGGFMSGGWGGRGTGTFRKPSLRSVGAGLAISGAGLALGAARRSMVENGTIEANSTGDIAMNAGATGLQLAGLGAMFGPWGAAIGGALGTIIGLVSGISKKMDADNKANVESKLGITLSGNYSSKDLRKLSNAADDGYLSRNEFFALDKALQNKLIQSGDFGKMGIQTYSWDNIPGTGKGGTIEGYALGGGVDSKLIATTPGEAVITKAAVAKHSGLLSAINQESGGNPIRPASGGLSIAPRQEYNMPKVAPSLMSIAPGYQQTKSEMDIKWSGSIKVEFPDGSFETIGSELLKDSGFKKKIANYAVETMNREQHGGQYRVNKGFRNI